VEKKKARRAGRQRLCLLTPEERAVKSANILRNIESLPELANARVVMGFAPLPDEVNMTALWHHLLARGVTLAFPAVADGDGVMEAVAVEDVARDLRPGRFGILAPAGGVIIAPGKIDFVFVPGVAYDMRGNRLGRGGGYYDRFLGDRAPQAFRCGVSFECQVVASVPVKDHDRQIHAVVTEKGVRRFDPARNGLSDIL
jgi:5-formyltetrahydrofolate cyclo-ligase